MCFIQGSLSGDQTNVLQQYINIIAIHWHKSCYVINNKSVDTKLQQSASEQCALLLVLVTHTATVSVTYQWFWTPPSVSVC